MFNYQRLDPLICFYKFLCDHDSKSRWKALLSYFKVLKTKLDTIRFVTFYAQLAQIFSPSHERNSFIISFSVKASLIKDIDIALR